MASLLKAGVASSHAADRKDVGRFVDWSRGRDLATGADPEPPLEPRTYGAVRA